MDTDRYPHAVAAYLDGNGWATSGTRVEDDVFAIVARRNEDGEQRQVTLVVADPDGTVGRKHLKYLLKAAKKKDAERACVTTQGRLSDTAQNIVAEYDIDVLDSETVVASVTDDGDDQSAGESAATGTPQPSQEQTRADPDHPYRREQEGTLPTEQQATHSQATQEPPHVTRVPPRQRAMQFGKRLRQFELPENSTTRLRRAVGNAPLLGGLLRGVGTYVVALFFALILYIAVLGNNVESVPGFPMLRRDIPQFVVESAWLFYSAQGVELLGGVLPGTETAIGFAVEQGERLAEAYTTGSSSVWLGFRLLYLVVPYLLFIEGYRLASKHYDGEASLVDQTVGGATTLVGYLPLVVAGSVVFGGSVSGQSLSASPLALVGMGLLQPLVFGGLGGLTAAAFRDTDARLFRGGYYGLAAFVVALAATSFLVILSSAGGTGTFGLVVTGLVVLPYAASFSFPATVDAGVPAIVLSLLVVGTLALAAAAMTRHQRNTDRVVDAAATGATVAMGFAMGLFTSLFVVLGFLLALDADQLDTTMDGLGFVLNAGTVHPVAIIVVGGVIVPVVVGSGVGVYLARTAQATPDGQPADD